MTPPKKPPAPPVFELKVRRTRDEHNREWDQVYLCEVGSATISGKRKGVAGSRECRMHGWLYPANADELVAWFASHGVAVVREEQPGESEVPSGLFEQGGG